jgi:hypothetical protein
MGALRNFDFLLRTRLFYFFLLIIVVRLAVICVVNQRQVSLARGLKTHISFALLAYLLNDFLCGHRLVISILYSVCG